MGGMVGKDTVRRRRGRTRAMIGRRKGGENAASFRVSFRKIAKFRTAVHRLKAHTRAIDSWTL